jgi:hypothetical protein
VLLMWCWRAISQRSETESSRGRKEAVSEGVCQGEGTPGS